MRYFAKPGGIERLSLEARLVYSFFCLFMLLGVASSLWIWLDDALGATAPAAQRYYLGDAASGEPSSVEAGDGPTLELPAETPAAPLRIAKPPRQVMETFHFHLFSVSVCLLIIAHLFMMCGLSTRTKSAVIVIGSAATMAHLLVPPAIRFVSPAFAVLMFPSALIMTITWLWMIGQPLVEMWVRVPRRAGGDRDDG